MRSYRTVSPSPVTRSPGSIGGLSLLHCPSGRPDLALASTLPCGVPTFLDEQLLAAGHPVDSPSPAVYGCAVGHRPERPALCEDGEVHRHRGVRRLLTVLVAGTVLAGVAAAVPAASSARGRRPRRCRSCCRPQRCGRALRPPGLPEHGVGGRPVGRDASAVRRRGPLRSRHRVAHRFDHPDWVENFTRVEWFLDVNGDSDWDLDVMMYVTSEGRPVFRVYRPNETVVCRGSATSAPSASRISVVVPASCFGSATRLRSVTRFHYEDSDFDVVRNDLVPNQGWSPWLAAARWWRWGRLASAGCRDRPHRDDGEPGRLPRLVTAQGRRVVQRSPRWSSRPVRCPRRCGVEVATASSAARGSTSPTPRGR